MDIVERLRNDYCNCLDSYKDRGRIDPTCESCQTKQDRTDAADEIERLRKQIPDGYKVDGWISVDDKLPDEFKDVLAFDGRHKFMAKISYQDGLTQWRADGEDENINTTHWQPLPASPLIEGK